MNRIIDAGTTTDLLGKPIEYYIKPVVKTLNMAGLITSQSCAGHYDLYERWAWVEVTSPIEDFQSTKARLHNYSMRAYCEILLAIFNTFIAKETRLVTINHGIFGAFRIEPSNKWRMQANTRLIKDFLRMKKIPTCSIRYDHSSAEVRDSRQAFLLFAKFLRKFAWLN